MAVKHQNVVCQLPKHLKEEEEEVQTSIDKQNTQLAMDFTWINTLFIILIGGPSWTNLKEYKLRNGNTAMGLSEHF